MGDRLWFRGIAASGLALAASGCLTSETPLFNAGNARAEALAVGQYEACEVEPGEAPSDCNTVTVARNDAGLYRLTAAGEDEAILIRFRKIGAGAFALQAVGEKGDGADYLVATGSPAKLSASLIDCDGLPEAFKQRYAARGELEDRGDDCVAKTAGVVVAAAKAWRRTDAFKSGDLVVYTKKS